MSALPRASDESSEGGLAAVLLPPVVHEASAAVLVVNLDDQTVTYANDLARELAPGLTLPLSVDEWSIAAGLEDVTGADLPEGPSDSPATPAESLLRIANGTPVTGEAVTAKHSTSATQSREVLWVLGLPMEGAPGPMGRHALVVFLPARNARLIAGVQESAVTLRDRAVLATRTSFTITDPTVADDPLVWVNPAFSATTGYEFDEAVGHNCRFLQGPETDRRVVAEIRASLQAQRPVTATLLNYRKDGTPFWNELSISPVRDNAGQVTHFVGVQADVTARVEAQRARDDAMTQVADAADRLALLADFTSRMARTRQPQQIVAMLASVLVPRVGTWCLVYTRDSAGNLTTPYVRHRHAAHDPEVARKVEQLRAVVPDQLLPTSPVLRVLNGEEQQVLITDYDAAPRQVTGAGEDDRTHLLHDLGMRSVAVVPLQTRRDISGCIAVVTDDSRPPLTQADLSLVADIGARAGLMLENAYLYSRERAAATTLQRSLMPSVPDIEGVEAAATYVTAADEAAVGGDWYDVFALRDGRGVGVVVGDVMGHNLDSAARMGKLSTIARAYGWPGSDPHTVLTAIDELLAGSDMDVLATCLYATLTLRPSGATLRYTSAGHPPALVRRPGGSVVALEGARGPMIGVSTLLRTTGRPRDATVDLAPGSTLICFTDGLIEAFDDQRDLDAGLAHLKNLIAQLPADASPRTVVDQLTEAAALRHDDIAVVAIRIG